MGVLAEFVRAGTATLIVGLDACDKRACRNSEARFGLRRDFFEGVCGYHEAAIDPFLKDLFFWIHLSWNEVAVKYGIEHVVFKFEHVAGNGATGLAFVGKALAVGVDHDLTNDARNARNSDALRHEVRGRVARFRNTVLHMANGSAGLLGRTNRFASKRTIGHAQ